MRLKVVNQLNCFPQGTCVGVLILLSLLFISFAQISRATEVPTVQTITTRHNNKRRNHTSDVTSSSLQLTPPLPLSPPSSILPLLPVKSSSSTFEQQVLKGLSIHRSRRDSFPSSGRRRHQRRGSPPHTPITGNKEQQELFLDVIDEVTRGGRCRMKDPPNVFLPSAVTATQELVSSLWKMKSYDTANRVSLLASLLAQYQPSSDHYKMLRNALDQLVRMDKEFFRARIAWTKSEKSSKDELMAEYFVHLERKRRLSTESYNKSLSLEEPWFKLPTSGRKNQYLHQLIKDRSVHISTSSFSREELSFSEWTPVYFSCELRKWLISFTSFIVSDSESLPGSNLYSLRGVISIDIDITETDFNQCDIPLDELDGPVSLIGTHKCDRESSLVSVVIICVICFRLSVPFLIV